MGKKRTRSKYISNGERRNVASSILKSVASDVSVAVKELHKIKAWRQGKNPWITVKNPIKNETNKPWIRVRANVELGDPKKIHGVFGK